MDRRKNKLFFNGRGRFTFSFTSTIIFEEVQLQIEKIFSSYKGKKLTNFPEIKYSNLYRKVTSNFYFEFQDKTNKYLFSPTYTPILGDAPDKFLGFINENHPFLDSLKQFIMNSLFVYSALVEENSYYLTNPQSIIIGRLAHLEQKEFEIKFYTHYLDELENSYNDKIYIGRDHINLDQFDRNHLGLKSYFRALSVQNHKIQERAKQKIRDYNTYKKPYLDEIDYSVREMVSDATERVEFFPETKICNISTVKLMETLDNILYLQNLMTELRELIREFESKLRRGDEIGFIRYLTKFSKDLKDGVRYLRKLSTHMHLRISNFPISKC